MGWSTMQASLDLGKFPSKEESHGWFHIHVQRLESYSSLGENGLLGKDSNIGELKTFL